MLLHSVQSTIFYQLGIWVGIGFVLWHTKQFFDGVFFQFPTGAIQLFPQCEPALPSPDAKFALAWLIGYAVS